jgi:uncharacterized damage-inducible protein DinB
MTGTTENQTPRPLAPPPEALHAAAMTPGAVRAVLSAQGIDGRRMPALPLARLLRELAGVVEALTDEQYAMTRVGVFPSSIGGHIRHSLDHVAALVRGIKCGRIDYDARERGTEIETSRGAALAAIRELETPIASLPAILLERRVFTKTTISASEPGIDVLSTVGRELAFVVSHTVHHNAIIGAMVKTLGASVPDRFGYAPSTIAWLDQNAA